MVNCIIVTFFNSKMFYYWKRVVTIILYIPIQDNRLHSESDRIDLDLWPYMYCTGQPIPNELKFWSAPPLFLEDEDIFQKSARVVLVPFLFQFRVVHASWFLSCIVKKKFFSPLGILSQIGRCW
jgi:hypothetical protein